MNTNMIDSSDFYTGGIVINVSGINQCLRCINYSGNFRLVGIGFQSNKDLNAITASSRAQRAGGC